MVTVHKTISSAVKLTKRPVSSKRSESKTRSVHGCRDSCSSTPDNIFKSRFLLFSCLFLLNEGRYCLIECWLFDQVSRSFCDLRTRTRLLTYIKYPGNILSINWKAPGSTLHLFMSKATVSICFTALKCP